MAQKKADKDKRSKKINHSSSSSNISDREIEDMVSHLWEHIDSLPSHVQDLLLASQDSTTEGQVSFVLAAGWALGKFEYVCANPWDAVSKSGWVATSGSVN